MHVQDTDSVRNGEEHVKEVYLWVVNTHSFGIFTKDFRFSLIFNFFGCWSRAAPQGWFCSALLPFSITERLTTSFIIQTGPLRLKGDPVSDTPVLQCKPGPSRQPKTWSVPISGT